MTLFWEDAIEIIVDSLEPKTVWFDRSSSKVLWYDGRTIVILLLAVACLCRHSLYW